MSQSNPPKSLHEHNTVVWGVVLVGTLVGWGFGTLGYWLYETTRYGHGSWLGSAYHGLQLFLLHMPHLTGPIPWQLELGRWVAPMATGLTGLVFLHRLARHEWHQLWLRRAREHVVVCGLGETGARIIREFATKMPRSVLVAIERDPGLPGVLAAEKLGVTVVIGDARDEKTLRQAKALRADHVLAVCTADDTNLAIATTLRKMAEREPAMNEREVRCRLLWENAELREKLAPELERKNAGTAGGVKVSGINVPGLLARKVFQEHPFDFDGISRSSANQAHVVLLGTCRQAKALAVKALQMCHFANRKPLRLTVVGAEAEKLLADLAAMHPGTALPDPVTGVAPGPWYDAMALAPPPTGDGLPDTAVKRLAATDFLTVVVCGHGCGGSVDKAESGAVVMALAVAEQLDELAAVDGGPAKCQVLVHLREHSGFGGFLATRAGAAAIHAFGAAESYCHPDALLHERQDDLAKQYHLKYLSGQAAKALKAKHEGTAHVPSPAAVPWELLPEFFRESNRLMADHLAVKLRAHGLRIGGANEMGANPPLGDPDDTLAIMEHERWCASYWLAGWKFGPDKCIEQRVHDCLVKWENLPQDMRYIDRNFIANTAAVLSKIGLGIHYRS